MSKTYYQKLKADQVASVVDCDGFDRIEVFVNGARFLIQDAAHAVGGGVMVPRELTPTGPAEKLKTVSERLMVEFSETYTRLAG